MPATIDSTYFSRFANRTGTARLLGRRSDIGFWILKTLRLIGAIPSASTTNYSTIFSKSTDFWRPELLFI
jgi:hypothetical protein